MSDRDRVVAAARTQLGVRYHSMNYSAASGYAGWMGTHYVGSGWGCAQFVAYCHNVVLGTKYVGSCYNYGGDCLGQSENQGGGQFRFVSAADALPGDCVLYGARGYNGSRYDHYGHIALYVGNGRVIGAMGKGKPGTAGYYNIGIRETTVAAQSLGGVIRYIRCTRLGDETGTEGLFPMQKKITVQTATLHVRSAPNLKDASLVGGVTYKKGDTINIDGLVLGDGHVWGHYTGATSGQDRYVSLGTTELAR